MGFYDYSKKKNNNKKLTKERDLYNLKYSQKNILTKNEIFERLIYKFLNESNHCLKQNIIEDVIDGDIGAIYGTGFPPYLGGPFNYINKIGYDNFNKKKEILNKKYGRYN